MSARLVSDLKRLHNSRREEWGDEKLCPLLKMMSWYLPQILLSFSENRQHHHESSEEWPLGTLGAGMPVFANCPARSMCPQWDRHKHHTDHGEEEASWKAQAIFVSNFDICWANYKTDAADLKFFLACSSSLAPVSDKLAPASNNSDVQLEQLHLINEHGKTGQRLWWPKAQGKEIKLNHRSSLLALLHLCCPTWCSSLH